MSTDAQRSAANLFTGTERRSMLREAAALLSSSQLATACGVVQNLIVLRLVPPAFIGIWTTMRTILDYGSHSSAGINRAAGVQMAVAAGRGDAPAMRRTADAAMTIEMATSGLLGVGLLAGAAWFGYENAAAWFAACLAAAVVGVVSRYFAFSLVALRSHKQFGTIARARIFGAAVELALYTSGAYFFHFYGLLAAAVLAQLANAWFVRHDGGLRFAPQFDWPLTKQLLIAGWPMAAEALALAALRSVDRFVILFCLANGEQQLGWYKIAIMMNAFAFDQSQMVANVLHPRLGETFGRTNDPSAVFRIGLRSAEVLALALTGCSAGLLAVGVPVVGILLPNFAPGLVAAGGLVAAAAFLGTSMPLRYALMTVGRTRSILITTALAAAVSLAGGVAVLRGNWVLAASPLASVAWTSAAAAAVSLFAMLAVCMASRIELLPAALRVISISIYGVAGAGLMSALRDQPGWCMLAAAGWSIVPVWQLVRQADWRDLLRRSTRDESASGTGLS
jgi:O-antigen/teichoic acid export membrane protein